MKLININEIDKYFNGTSLQLSNHEEKIAAIRAQPSYHRSLFLQDYQPKFNRLTIVHAVFRALCASPVTKANETVTFVKRLKSRYGENINIEIYWMIYTPKIKIKS